MPKKRKIIPFWLMPASWGLKGNTRKRAEIEYYYDGEELEEKLLQLDLENETDEKRKQRILLKHDLKKGKISQYEYRARLLEIEHNIENEKDQKKTDKDYKLKKLELDFQYDKISKRDYERQRADLLGIPWVDVSPETKYDPSQKQNGFYLVLDYNKHFVKMLIENGYANRGKTDQEIVDAWFKDVIYGILLEDENSVLNQ